MTTKTQTTETARVAAALAGNPSVEARVQAEIMRSSMVSRLLSMRVAKNVTQERVAGVIGCDASRISRLEAGNDLSLKLSDIVGYMRALDMELTVSFANRGLPASARIKHCVFEIDRGLQELASLAASVGADDRITQGIHRFYAEVLFNFITRFKEGWDSLGVSMKFPSEPSTAEDYTGRASNTGPRETAVKHATAEA